MIKLTLPENGAVVSLLAENHKVFLSEEFKEERKSLELTSVRWEHPRAEKLDSSTPAPVRFEWEDHIDWKSDPKYRYEFDMYNDGLYTIIISQNADLSNPLLRTTANTYYDCYNLLVGTTYYWCVQKDVFRSEIRSFSTAYELPRIIKVDGLSNIRDFGGYRVPGGRIRQAIIYRGSEFDRHEHISESGLDAFLQLGLRTELDLRGECSYIEYGPMEAFGIKRISIPLGAYKNAHIQKEQYHDVFTLLANKEVYPLYIHCHAGADRTGCIVFLLKGFLGVDIDLLIDDYELSGLSKWGPRSRNDPNFQAFLNGITEFDGDTLQEKITNYFTSFLGLTNDTLESIRSILIEPDE